MWEQANPSIGGAARALAVGVGDLRLTVEDDVFVRPRAADDAVQHGNRGSRRRFYRGASYQFCVVKLAKALTVDVCTGDGAAGDRQVAVGMDVKPGLEPIKGGVSCINVLSEKCFGVPSTINRLCPEHIGWCKVIRIEGDHKVGVVQWGVKLNHVLP